MTDKAALYRLADDVKEMEVTHPASETERVSWRAVEGTRNGYYRMEYDGGSVYDLFTRVRTRPGSIDGIVATDVVLRTVWGHIEIATETVDTVFDRGDPPTTTLDRYRDDVNAAIKRLATTAETREREVRDQ